MKVLVSNIQRFCLKDGKGIRTTIFLKGCSLHCPWCANPENIKKKPENGFNAERCIKKDGSCILNQECPIVSEKNIFNIESIEQCAAGAICKIGEYMDEDVLLVKLLKDSAYYGNQGGITFSGGEPLLQIREIKNVVSELRNRNINVNVETSLYVSKTLLREAINLIDFFIVDIKLLDSEISRKTLGLTSQIFVENIKYLFENVNPQNILGRICMVPGLTATQDNLILIKKLLDEVKFRNLEIFSVHNLAEMKYFRLNLDFNQYQEIDFQELKKMQSFLETDNRKVSIIRI